MHDPNRPAVHRPAHVDHAVLLGQVVVVLHLRHVSRQVAGIVVDLDGHAPPAVFQHAAVFDGAGGCCHLLAFGWVL